MLGTAHPRQASRRIRLIQHEVHLSPRLPIGGVEHLALQIALRAPESRPLRELQDQVNALSLPVELTVRHPPRRFDLQCQHEKLSHVLDLDHQNASFNPGFPLPTSQSCYSDPPTCRSLLDRLPNVLSAYKSAGWCRGERAV